MKSYTTHQFRQLFASLPRHVQQRGSVTTIPAISGPKAL